MARFQTWKPTIDLLAGFKPMTDWPELVHDRWPPGTLTAAKRRAYDLMAQRGEIQPVGVVREGREVIVSYRAQIPGQWVHDLLRGAME